MGKKTAYFAEEVGPLRKPSSSTIASLADSGISRSLATESEVPSDLVTMMSSTSSSSIIPADGGWGWWVVFGSFLANALVDGLLFSFGVFYLEVMECFDASQSRTALVPSLINGLHLLIGPVTCALLNRYTCRRVVVAGALISSLGFSLSAFAPNLEAMIFTYGVIGGVGISFMYIPSIVIVSLYFQRKRALAIGIAMCGSGLGTFGISFLSKYTIEAFGWRGAMLVLAGLMLNGAVAGMLYRPICIMGSKSQSLGPSDENMNNSLPDIHTEKVDKQDHVGRSNNPVRSNNPELKTVKSSPLFVNLLKADQYLSASTPNIKSAPFMATESRMPNSAIEISFQKSSKKKKLKELLSHPMYHTDIFYSGSVFNLPEYQSNPVQTSFTKSMIRIPEEKTNRRKPCCFTRCLPSNVTDTFLQMTDMSLLRNPVFMLLMCSHVLATGQATVVTYITDLGLKQGLSMSEAPFMISVIGISSTFGRILVGWFTDRQLVPSVYIYGTALMGAGLSTIFMPICGTFDWMVLLSAVFGFCMASYATSRTIIIVDLLGIENLTNAFGLIAMSQGVAYLIAPPFAGFLYEVTESYTIPYVMSGTCYILSSAICIVLVVCAVKKKDIIGAYV